MFYPSKGDCTVMPMSQNLAIICCASPFALLIYKDSPIHPPCYIWYTYNLLTPACLKPSQHSKNKSPTLFIMHSIIGFAFILLCGSVAAQQTDDASTAVQVRHPHLLFLPAPPPAFFVYTLTKRSESSLNISSFASTLELLLSKGLGLLRSSGRKSTSASLHWSRGAEPESFKSEVMRQFL